MLDTTTPDAPRLLMVVDAARQSCSLERCTNGQMTAAFGEAVARHINAGRRAIVHLPDSPNLVVFDAVLAAVRQNGDLFTEWMRLEW